MNGKFALCVAVLFLGAFLTASADDGTSTVPAGVITTPSSQTNETTESPAPVPFVTPGNGTDVSSTQASTEASTLPSTEAPTTTTEAPVTPTPKCGFAGWTFFFGIILGVVIVIGGYFVQLYTSKRGYDRR
ncbi:hypothetical protein HDE_10036 [Halotydeus destructor]|nr:hypothetical protein HDE_10036 [Halotydeus destructor]